MKSIKLALLLLILHLNVYAMHQHESSSIVPNKEQELTVEQQAKIADELSDGAEIELKPSKLDQVNSFILEALNQHLLKDLSKMVFDYDPVNTEYTSYQEINDINISSIAQLNEGSLFIDGNIWKLQNNGQYLCCQTLNKNEEDCFKFLVQLKDNSLVVHKNNTNEISLFRLNKDGNYHCCQILKEKSFDNLKVIQLKDGSLVSAVSCYWNRNFSVTMWKQNKDGAYFIHQFLPKHHKRAICDIIELKNGSLASCSMDNTIKILKLDKDGLYHCQQTLVDGIDKINNIIQLQDGSLVSYSFSRNEIKIWKLNEKGLYYCNQTINEYERVGDNLGIFQIIQLQDKSLASRSSDHTIKIWKLNKDGQYYCCQNLEGHTMQVIDILELQDGSLASRSSDHTIKIWKLKKDTKYYNCQTIDKHHYIVEKLIQLQDGSLVSYSGGMDQKLMFWQNELNKLKIPSNIKDEEEEIWV